METVPVTEMLCFFFFFGVQDSRKCLQTEFLINFIKINSVIRCICKTVKSNYYLHHVCPSVCLLGMTWFPLRVLSFFFWGGGGPAEKIQVSLQSDKNSRTLCEDRYTFWSYLTHFFLEWEMFQTKVVKKIKTHFIFSNFFFKKIVPLMR
jgi:hypothetical protein